MTDVLIVYSHEDEALAASIAAQAKILGLDVRAEAQHEPDPLDAEAVEAQIDEAGVTLVCWSEHAVASTAIRTRAAIASARGKLTACRLAPCSIPFPFDAAPTAELQDWAEKSDSPQWRTLVAAIGEKLQRPGLAALLEARIAGGGDALDAFVRHFPDEPEARRIWSERESKYREECASMLRDARHHLEQRVASEQSKIEKALEAFSKDFDAWLERERRGEAGPKPSLNTLFEIWLERGGRRGEPKNDNDNDAPAAANKDVDERLARAEAEALALRERLEAETEKVQQLERELLAAEEQDRRAALSEEGQLIDIVPLSSSSVPAPAPPPKRRGRGRFVALALIALAGIGAAAYGKFIRGTENEPPQMSAAIEWLESASAEVEEKSRAASTRLAMQAGGFALDTLLANDKEATIARVVAFDPETALAKLQIFAPDRLAGAAPPASISAETFFSSADADQRRELVSLVVRNAPSEALSQLIAERKDETLDRLLRSERPALLARLNEIAPDEIARLSAAKASSAAPPQTPAQQALLRLPQLAPRDILKTLEANVSPQNLSELGKLLTAAAPQKVVNYRTFENRDIESDDVTKLRNLDLPACVSACRKKDSCKGYTFDKWNRVCYLKASIGGFKLNPRSTSGLREDIRPPKPPTGEITMERYPSKAFPGAGYRTAKTDDSDTCEQLCRADDACVAFTFRLDQGSCHLFKTTGEYFKNELADSGGKRQE